ncbi:hypothetical protein [Phytohabitans kaempferiae]|uniref:Uncharacterized protein n=1 Tax=Phytohabitans kaempferiae TaxID=1620943 RepID=A0ABV6M1U5_9ACTN
MVAILLGVVVSRLIETISGPYSPAMPPPPPVPPAQPAPVAGWPPPQH